ncbi:MAG: hypothetical protein KF873_05330 [Gemmataceae bacterium]|nr:hypothetical protein [Gemmataceae bacterium]
MDNGNEFFDGLNDSTVQRKSREKEHARDRQIQFAYLLLFFAFLGISVGLSAAIGAQFTGDPGENLIQRFAVGTAGIYLGALLGFGREFLRVSLREFKADVFNERTEDPGMTMTRGMILMALLIGPFGASIAFNDRPPQWGAYFGGLVAGLAMTLLCGAAGFVKLTGSNRRINQGDHF